MDNPTTPPAKDTAGASTAPARGVGMIAVLLLTGGAAVLTVAGVLGVHALIKCQQVAATDAGPTEDKPLAAGPELFQNWPKPDFVLLLSAQQHGYILPCGCSRPQLGGLERRYNFLKGLEKRDWNVVSLDLGDIPQMRGPANLPNVQGMLKYVYSMKALKAMNYAAVGIGEYEAAMPLAEGLSEFALNEKPPFVLVGNLKTEGNDVFKESTVESHVATVEDKKANTKYSVGVVSVVGTSVADKIKDPNVKFDPVRNRIKGLIQKLDTEKVQFKVLLYQGSLDHAKLFANTHKDFQVILCLCEEDEPPMKADRVGNTMIVQVGHKGKHVGVVGVFKGGPANGFDLRYQMVTLGEEYLTPEAEEKAHPILALMEDYTKDLKDRKILEKYVPVNHPLQNGEKQLGVPHYVGSDVCLKCHKHAYDVWKNTPHSHAFKTLVDAKNPGNRQFDAECIVCHTVGFGYKTGYPTEPVDSKGNKHNLLDVGCESCHGPCSVHVKNNENGDWHKLINPYKYDPDEEKPANKAAKAQRELKLDLFCQKCHDADNDVKWDFKLKWPKIEHRNPPIP